MKQSQKSSLWLGVIFLTCFLSLIVLTNVHMTQLKERQRLESDNTKVKNDITALYNERVKEVDIEALNYGLKNGVVSYDDKSVLDLK